MRIDDQSEARVRYTLWDSLYNIDAPEAVTETWGAFCKRLSTHTLVSRKDQAAGFGPYVLGRPEADCYKHKDGIPRSTPHRCFTSVVEQTMLVFDVDVGTADQVVAADSKLEAAGLARHWYSTCSHKTEKPALRLIIPVSRPFSRNIYNGLRRAVIEEFAIPCNPGQCSGASHFYYLPSCKAFAPTVTETSPGRPLDIDAYKRFFSQESTSAPAAHPDIDWSPPEGEVMDLAPLKEALTQRRNAVVADYRAHRKAVFLANLLEGRPLAPHGERNTATLVITGMLAYTIPGQSLATYRALLRPSLEAMVAAGSKLTWETVDRMLMTAMYSKAKEDRAAQKEVEAYQQLFYAMVPNAKRRADEKAARAAAAGAAAGAAGGVR